MRIAHPVDRNRLQQRGYEPQMRLVQGPIEQAHRHCLLDKCLERGRRGEAFVHNLGRHTARIEYDHGPNGQSRARAQRVLPIGPQLQLGKVRAGAGQAPDQRARNDVVGQPIPAAPLGAIQERRQGGFPPPRGREQQDFPPLP